MISGPRYLCAVSRLFFVPLLLLLFGGCAASGPATSYYSLFANENVQRVGSNHSISLGVGPLDLPEYLENPAIVSLTGTQRVRIAGYHAWAGNLNEAMTRVLADDLASLLAIDDVWAFPWDSRSRPEYQLRLVFEEFAGTRGGPVRLSAKWRLMRTDDSEVVAVSRVDLQASTSSDSVDDYVAALNQLLNRLSVEVATAISASLD